MLRDKEHDQVEVYDDTTFHLKRCLTVPNCRGLADITSCEHHRCIYASYPDVKCVCRLDVDLQDNATQWPVDDKPRGLSVNGKHNLLVTCDEARKIKEYTSHGDLIREITLPSDVVHPWHAIQLTSGQFIVCHGRRHDAVQRVCVVSTDGRQIVHSHGGQRGSHTSQYNGPIYLAVYHNQSVLVADVHNGRVKLLSPTLGYIRDVVTSELLKWVPRRLCLDTKERRLYVADNELKDGKWLAGRVVVFNVE